MEKKYIELTIEEAAVENNPYASSNDLLKEKKKLEEILTSPHLEGRFFADETVFGLEEVYLFMKKYESLLPDKYKKILELKEKIKKLDYNEAFKTLKDIKEKIEKK